MAKQIRNLARSLDIVVSAPIETCVAALNGLHEDGYVLREKVRVDTHPVRRDLYQFTVKLSVARGREQMDTSLRGTLRQDEYSDTTTIVAEVPSIHRRLLLGLILAMIPFTYFTVNLLPLIVGLVVMTLTLILLWITIQVYYEDDRADTQRVISLTEDVLRQAESR
jgi:hypothetical protein